VYKSAALCTPDRFATPQPIITNNKQALSESEFGNPVVSVQLAIVNGRDVDFLFVAGHTLAHHFVAVNVLYLLSLVGSSCLQMHWSRKSPPQSP
jgi:hypothetical protein